MARLLVIVLILSVIVAVGSKFYFEKQIRKSLDQSAQMASMVGLLKYDAVEITHEGEVRIEGLSFQPHGAPEAATVDLIAVRPGSMIKLFQLEKDMRNNTVPTALGFSVYGVEVPISEEYEQLHSDNSQFMNMGLRGCASPAEAGFPGMKALGYSLVDMNLDIDYEIIGEGEHLRVNIDTFADGIAKSTIALDLRLGASSRHMAAMSMSLNNAELNSLSLKNEDYGYQKRLLEYCAKSADLALTDYYPHHVEGWQATWNNLDLAAGENFTKAYQAYIEKPDSFEVDLFASETFKLSELYITQPNILIYHLKGNVSTNGNDSEPLDLAAYTGERASINNVVTERKQVEVVEPTIAVSELQNYLHKPVEITLNNGKRYQGKAQSVDKTRIQFLRNIGSGQLQMPIKIDEVAKIVPL